MSQDRSLQKIIDMYIQNISQWGDVLRQFFDGVYDNLHIQFIKKNEPKYVFQKEIFIVHFGQNIGSEYNGLRPALVVSNGKLNTGGLVTVVPITTAQGKCMFLGDQEIEPTPYNGLSERSFIRSYHIKTIAKKRLKKKIGTCDDKLFEEVCFALHMLFASQTQKQKNDSLSEPF